MDLKKKTLILAGLACMAGQSFFSAIAVAHASPLQSGGIVQTGPVKMAQYYRDGQSESKAIFRYGTYLGRVLASHVDVNAFSSGDASTARSLSYSYGPQGKVLSFKNDLLGGIVNSGSADQLNITYQYSGLGLVQQIQRSNGWSTFNIYNSQKRLVDILIGASLGNPKLVYHYTYNLNNEPDKIMITSSVHKVSGTIISTYRYNSRNQLISFTTSGSDKALYAHNAFGSIITGQTYTYGMDNNITSVATRFVNPNQKGHAAYTAMMATYYYDTAGGHPDRLVSIHFGVDGDLPGYQYIQSLNRLYHQGFTYNGLNQISTDPQQGQYGYNLADVVIHYASNAALPNRVNVYYGRNAKGLSNYEQSYLTSSSGTTSKMNGQAAYFANIAGLRLAQQNGAVTLTQPGFANFVATTSGGITHDVTQGLYAVAQGSIAMTTHHNSISHLYTYSPYGMQSDALHLVNTSQQADFNVLTTRKVFNTTHNHAGYTGQDLDSSTGYMMLGHFRLYDPNLGTYIGHDSLNVFSGKKTDNPWAYAKANPMLYTDPTGHNVMTDVFDDVAKFVEGIGEGAEENAKFMFNAATSIIKDAVTKPGEVIETAADITGALVEVAGDVLYNAVRHPEHTVVVAYRVTKAIVHFGENEVKYLLHHPRDAGRQFYWWGGTATLEEKALGFGGKFLLGAKDEEKAEATLKEGRTMKRRLKQRCRLNRVEAGKEGERGLLHSVYRFGQRKERPGVRGANRRGKIDLPDVAVVPGAHKPEEEEHLLDKAQGVGMGAHTEGPHHDQGAVQTHEKGLMPQGALLQTYGDEGGGMPSPHDVVTY